MKEDWENEVVSGKSLACQWHASCSTKTSKRMEFGGGFSLVARVEATGTFSAKRTSAEQLHIRNIAAYKHAMGAKVIAIQRVNNKR